MGAHENIGKGLEKNHKINLKVEEWALKWKTIETEVHDIRDEKEEDNLLMVLSNMVIIPKMAIGCLPFNWIQSRKIGVYDTEWWVEDK